MGQKDLQDSWHLDGIFNQLNYILNSQILWAAGQNVLVLVPVISNDVKTTGVGKDFLNQRHPSRGHLRSSNMKPTPLASKGDEHSLLRERSLCVTYFQASLCSWDVSLALTQKWSTSLTFCLTTLFIGYSAFPSAGLLTERTQPASHRLGTSVFILSWLFSLPPTSHLELTFPSAPGSSCRPLHQHL